MINLKARHKSLAFKLYYNINMSWNFYSLFRSMILDNLFSTSESIVKNWYNWYNKGQENNMGNEIQKTEIRYNLIFY